MRTVTWKPSTSRGFRAWTGAAALALALGGAGACAQTSPAPAPTASACRVPAFEAAARINAASLTALAWAPFRRAETGWEVYAPLVARDLRTGCGPTTSRFAQLLAGYQRQARMRGTGEMDVDTFNHFKGVWQERRPFVMVNVKGICPDPPDPATLALADSAESYGGKTIPIRPGALDAYRRMVAAARRESPAIGADPRNLTIFSGFRAPDADDVRCLEEGNCDGVARATCSAHRTGLAFDLYVGEAPGFRPDSSADPNRLFMTKTPAYAWLLANAGRYGFVNYPFEPWHWEWIGQAP